MYIIGEEDGEEELGLIDHPNKPFAGIPILSVIGVLNDDYEGGELILLDDYQVKLKAGEAVVFPSNFMYPHQVKKVTRGTRMTINVWFS